MQTKTQLSCTDVANYFLALANETGEVITNLKLQKLVYYAQAWYLANNKTPIFEEDFEAWVHGPVVPSLYRTYKERGSAPIVVDFNTENLVREIEKELMIFLKDVAGIYMPYGAYALEAMTHSERPWIDARQGFEPDEKCSNIISKQSMQDYYGKKI